MSKNCKVLLENEAAKVKVLARKQHGMSEHKLFAIVEEGEKKRS